MSAFSYGYLYRPLRPDASVRFICPNLLSGLLIVLSVHLSEMDHGLCDGESIFTDVLLGVCEGLPHASVLPVAHLMDEREPSADISSVLSGFHLRIRYGIYVIV